ncbi:helix-turn-helix transcriptional regulator [Staphylococcus haemolyticus]|jgi:transcriptional regulator with XRE-family HTH domain|uniref:Helix-turn-helix transcriptional regulator n=1 Tax=Staphylococcus haemolyticus TaxID=1283 RepID=A0ABU3IFC3_STAHA|nr:MULTISPECIES: helix-turn-helix transcriptional regulator [Bacteria]MBK3939980.1 helix-turn-helix transcriptional regulator [Staphylococcus haemolyticus]MBK3940047.1 helix-turn-helix transcriptional regulator [Staphylococcus haemolyticus]MBK3950217.1 helix-turn-helix transcriptional regulator [Staphylococcus haemolyticus]MCH4336041.1 helix-turn-helix domain-containing protein [Staphylococcus haemolyticus]MCH4507260.1 helix-turn-helix domain-containing protein [Staphylococcus haemolyticus]
MRNNDEIIELVTKLMDKNDLSTSELARRLNIAKSSVSRYLNKTSQFPLNKVNEFSRALNVTPEYLLGVGEYENKQQDTMAAHLDYSDLTEDEQKEVEQFIQFIRNRKK